MLVRLLYVSQPVGPITTTMTTLILEKSDANNKKQDITGVLCQGSGLYMQALEGSAAFNRRNFAKTVWPMVYDACLFV